MALIPPNAGSLFSAETKRRLKLALAGSVVSALAEVAGVATIVPLMQLITGASTHEGVLGRINRLLGNPPDQVLSYFLAALVLGTFLAKGVFNILFRRWMIRFVSLQSVHTGDQLLRRYLSAPYWMHLQRNTAELTRTLLDGVDQTYSLVVVGAVGAVSELVTILALFLVLLVIMPVPALLAVAYFAICGFAVDRLIRSPATSAGKTMADSAHQVYVTAFQALGGVKEIKVRQRGQHFLDAYVKARMEFALARSTSGFLAELPRYILEIVFILGVALVAAAVYATNSGPQALALVALFVAAGFRLLPSLVRLVSSLSNIRVGRAGFDLVLADINSEMPTEPWAGTDGHDLPLTQVLRLEGVSYRYPGAVFDVVREVDIDVPRGSSVALVGASGAGKSTIVDLILGLHRPTGGRITVDGVDIAEAVPTWQRTLGLVPQDVYLIDESLRSNVAFGENAGQIDESRINEAVQRAQLGDLVGSLPDGLDTLVGERGMRLSGGQRQRIGIARALYLRPQVLILDEATSALDNETERRITETIESLHGDMTIIVVAHRLSTVRNCDLVVFLNQGRVEVEGTFEEVRTRSTEFANLVALGSLEAEPLSETPAGEVR
jgi:ABC-type multidrug transport system fused ATPase/permease subunit